MARRSFAREFKESAARLVAEQGYTVAQAANSLGVDPSSIREWVKKFAPPADQAASPSDESMISLRRENERLRAENKRLLMEREILKKATAFFAREPS